jgi:hypothetical protein
MLRAVGALSQVPALISLAFVAAIAGCSSDDSVVTDADEDFIAESIELFEAELVPDPGTNGLEQGTREEGLVFRINVLKTMGVQASAAAPALEKLRDTTRNPDLKEAITEALAEIQG